MVICLRMGIHGIHQHFSPPFGRIFISLRLMPPTVPGLEMCGSTATSTTSVPTPAAPPAPVADMHWQPYHFIAPQRRKQKLARSTTKSSSKSSNNQQQQQEQQQRVITPISGLINGFHWGRSYFTPVITGRIPHPTLYANESFGRVGSKDLGELHPEFLSTSFCR